MDAIRSLQGVVAVSVTGADLPGTLAAIGKQGIEIWEVIPDGELTLQFCVLRRDYRLLRELTQKRGDRLRLIHHGGLYWTLKSLLKRPLLLLGCMVLIALVLYVPSRVFFVQVDGNTTIPSRMILEAAEKNGVYFGASRRQVRSERVKNALLAELPQLQWVGVNTDGCVAVISVRERTDSKEAVQSSGVSSLVAARDGVILSCTVTRGSGLCTLGQAVQAGEVLISGYTDCGLTVTATDAQGEIIAQTMRDFEAVMADTSLARMNIGSCTTKISLILGKKRINFYKDSGILEGSCVKMYERHQLVLPGGFCLPIVWVVEKSYPSTCAPAAVNPAVAEEELKAFAQEYLKHHMVAGDILGSTQQMQQESGVFRLTGTYACTEMIGIRRREKIGDYHGKTD